MRIEHYDERVIFDLLARGVMFGNGIAVEVDHQGLAKIMIPVILVHHPSRRHEPCNVAVANIGTKRATGEKALASKDWVVAANRNDALGKGIKLGRLVQFQL